MFDCRNYQKEFNLCFSSFLLLTVAVSLPYLSFGWLPYFIVIKAYWLLMLAVLFLIIYSADLATLIFLEEVS